MRLTWLLLLVVALTACPKSDQSLVLVGGEKIDAARIDNAPLDLLPSGALFIGKLDAPALFNSSMGPHVAQIVKNVLPLGPESNFVANRDLRHIYNAVYAMQGADFVAVLQGNFDVNAIQRAAAARSQTPSGVPLVHTRYGDYDIYTVANVGFVLLTPRTVLSGNETGMRRALDRLRYGRLETSIAPWMDELLANEKAAFAMVGDVSGQGVVTAFGDRLPFVSGLNLLRVMGNFQTPGMNVVGSLTYADEERAAQGAVALGQIKELAFLASLIATWGLGAQTPEIQVVQQRTNVAFATSFDTATVGVLLGFIAQLTTPGQTPRPGAWWWGG
ncbi:MAG TPA: hypothetical protein VFB62_04630 [Polyangiaceae bacterium]|jgi:hypothetical protein|nr:hypothetical protein [Polyangiaceae bacterium]